MPPCALPSLQGGKAHDLERPICALQPRLFVLTPLTRSVPSVGCSISAIRRSSVVFPQAGRPDEGDEFALGNLQLYPRDCLDLAVRGLESERNIAHIDRQRAPGGGFLRLGYCACRFVHRLDHMEKPSGASRRTCAAFIRVHPISWSTSTSLACPLQQVEQRGERPSSFAASTEGHRDAGTH
jgi:hypothetical protein